MSAYWWICQQHTLIGEIGWVNCLSWRTLIHIYNSWQMCHKVINALTYILKDFVIHVRKSTPLFWDFWSRRPVPFWFQSMTKEATPDLRLKNYLKVAENNNNFKFSKRWRNQNNGSKQCISVTENPSFPYVYTLKWLCFSSLKAAKVLLISVTRAALCISMSVSVIPWSMGYALSPSSSKRRSLMGT